MEKEPEFQASSVTTGVEGHRKSRVLFAIKDSKWRDIFLRRLGLHLPHILSTLNVSDFSIGESEIQLTASNDGDFFKPHADASRERAATDKEAATASREITYVYYLHRMPRPFAGGSLLIYEGGPGQPAYESGKVASTIAPHNNCLIAFGSNRWHEVDMVRCPSGEFADSRFTVNGWLRRSSS